MGGGALMVQIELGFMNSKHISVILSEHNFTQTRGKGFARFAGSWIEFKWESWGTIKSKLYRKLSYSLSWCRVYI